VSVTFATIAQLKSSKAAEATSNLMMTVIG